MRGVKKNWPAILPVDSKHGRLTIVSTPFRGSDRRIHVQTRCECGTISSAACVDIERGHTLSCGCLHNEQVGAMYRTHGESHGPLHEVWKGMKSRCYNPKNANFMNYGGRGITVCEEWRNSYEAFRDWMLANGYKPGLEIDRKDNAGNYSPDNCRVVERKVNQRNKRTSRLVQAFGETKTLKDWSEDPRCVVSYRTLFSRYKLDWDMEDAITKPLSEQHVKSSKSRVVFRK